MESTTTRPAAASKVLDLLEGVRETKSGWQARCPAHDDRTPSLHVSETRDGKVLVKCHAGCSAEAVVKAVGLTMADLFPRRERASRNGKARIVASYDYLDERGELLFQAVRYTPKDFRQRRPQPGGGWKWSATGVRRVLYRLPELLTADASETVYVTEGEKDADRLASLGLIATTNVGGAGKWRGEHSETLRDRNVVILPDNDDAGRKHARKVAHSLHGIASSVRIVELPDLAVKGDASDWINAGGTVSELLQLVDEAAEWTPEDDDFEVKPELKWQPFPVRVLPEPMRGFAIAGSKALDCDPANIVLPMLSAAGAAIGNSRCVQLKKSWSEPPIVWTVIVTESGGTKTPALDLVLNPLWKRQMEWLKGHAKRMEKYGLEVLEYEKAVNEWKKNKGKLPEKKPVKPTASRLIVSDTTIEALGNVLLENPRGVLLARDELAAWFGSFDQYRSGSGRAGADAAKWCSIHSAQPIIIDRKTEPKIVTIPSPHVPMCGGIQPGRLRHVLGEEHYENGVFARFLPAMSPRHTKRWKDADITDGLKKSWADLIDRLMKLKPVVVKESFADTSDDFMPDTEQKADDKPDTIPRSIELSPEARRLWIDFYNEHAVELSEADGHIASMLSKLEAAAARLALIIHLVGCAVRGDDTDPPINAESMAAGITLARWFAHEGRRIYAALAEKPEEGQRRRLVEWIRRRGGTTTPRDVVRGFPGVRDTDAATALLDALDRDKVCRRGPLPSTGGRQKFIYELLDHATVTEVHETREIETSVTVTQSEDSESEWGEA